MGCTRRNCSRLVLTVRDTNDGLKSRRIAGSCSKSKPVRTHLALGGPTHNSPIQQAHSQPNGLVAVRTPCIRPRLYSSSCARSRRIPGTVEADPVTEYV